MGWRERPNAPAPGTALAALDEVPADNGLERVFGEGPGAFRLVLFRMPDGVRAYVDECPHARIPLGFSPGVYCVIEADGRRDLLCPHHSAMFALDDGACWDGPCRGDRLQRIEVAVGDGIVRVA
ncbi:MAG TPA: Rieske (2Fe-2S) protein [Burkholderiaceae bacterium]|nr:Rieske (2Fe-2S) protein [Burkholderiaceae bacterium]